ncbi:schlafen family member 13 [Anas platyrhynchos]|uniref:Schlafen family member 13 n=1 Tax=Anas platyrhynchos platyrhynchos TaxID=8840 RepID=U3IJA9_ANAPP
MALEDHQPTQWVWVDSATKYPEVVLNVGKICFGEKARKKMPKNSKQDQKYTLASAVCALLNSGGGVVKAEIENEDYSLQRDEIGLDLHETFRSLLLTADLAKYLDFKQQDNYLLIFVKTWSSEKASLERKPRICTLSSGLYSKCGAFLSHMTVTEATLFLEEKQDEARRELSPETPAKKSKASDVEEDMDIVNDNVAELFNRDQLQYRETLNFTESADVEFKHYSTDNFLKRVNEILPQYISGFANARGGYLWIGVDDDRRVQGFMCDDENVEKLSHLIKHIEYKLKVFHFCNRGYKHSIMCKHKIFEVYDEAGKHRGHVCAVKIEPFTCAVFAKDPESWQVEGTTIKKLNAEEWAKWMISADPDLSGLSQTFTLALSLSEGPPLAKPVYSHQGLDNVDDLCKKLFPVKSRSIIYTPEKLTEDLFQEHPELQILMEEQLRQISEGIVISSRSWAVDVGLPENRDIICDILVLATDWPPILYTVCKHQISKDLFEYSKCTARKLKEKLVNTGGYIHKLCIIPKLLILPPVFNHEEGDVNIQEMYPQNYSLIKRKNLKDLLRSLTIALLTFKSFLSDRVGSEVLNVLTMKQYQLLSENLHKTKKLFVYGLPGTGKTIVALNIIEKIRSMFQCGQQEVLYICENQPLRDFVIQKNICQAVTRVAFLRKTFNDVKHIIIDEAQNFQDGDGDWYQKALDLTSSPHLPEPGFLWIFLDYLQTSHSFSTGLPEPRWHDPVESLTKVVRNANSIFCYLKNKMEKIVEDPAINIPQKHLQKLLRTASCASAVPGFCETVEEKDKDGIAESVAKCCCTYLKIGYSEEDIAILCYRDDKVEEYREILTLKMKERKLKIFLGKMDGGLERYTILDSFRRFSGLERTIVFGIVPNPLPYQDIIFENVLVCVASRANLNLHLFYEYW